MNKIIVFVAAVIIGILVVFWLQSDDVVDGDRIEPVDEGIVEENEEDQEVEEETDEADVVIDMTAAGREFFVDGEANPLIQVNQGDIVELNFEVTDGVHDFAIDALGVGTDILNEGQTQTIVFEASEVGEFEYYCSVGSHRDEGMFGAFEVLATE